MKPLLDPPVALIIGRFLVALFPSLGNALAFPDFFPRRLGQIACLLLGLAAIGIANRNADTFTLWRTFIGKRGKATRALSVLFFLILASTGLLYLRNGTPLDLLSFTNWFSFVCWKCKSCHWWILLD